MPRDRGSLLVAVIADTHGKLDPRVGDAVARCDLAVHAGDVGAAGVLQALRPRRGEVLAVRGNNDVAAKWPPGEVDVLESLPWEASWPLPGGELMVVHGDRAGPARRRHDRLRDRYPDARAVVYGHSHRLVIDCQQDPWILNPGAAGRARTYGGPSCLILRAGPRRWQVEVCRFSPPR